jgi:hypothetical protein
MPAQQVISERNTSQNNCAKRLGVAQDTIGQAMPVTCGFTLVLSWLDKKWHQRCHKLAHRRSITLSST